MLTILLTVTSLAIYSCIPLKAIQYYIIITWLYRSLVTCLKILEAAFFEGFEILYFVYSCFTSLSTAVVIWPLWSLVAEVQMPTFYSAVRLNYHTRGTRHDIPPHHILQTNCELVSVLSVHAECQVEHHNHLFLNLRCDQTK